MEKFSLGFYDKKVEEALSRVHDEDPEVVEIAFTEAANYGTQMRSPARSTFLPNGIPRQLCGV